MLQFSKHKEMALFLSSLTQAAITIFSSFCTAPVKAAGARKIGKPIPEADIYGTVHFTGHTAGKVEIALNKDMARQLAANVAMCEPSQLSDKDIYDGVGEVINQIAGHTRTRLWDEGFKTEISIPVVTGKSNLPEPDKKDTAAIYVIDFDCSAGFIALQICLRFAQAKPTGIAQS